jgi:hypothetical protein
MAIKGNDSWTEVVVLKHDLRALLFWASVGISVSKSGGYRDAEGEGGIVATYARDIKFSLSRRPIFKR